jgi:hypothetical protein
MYVISLAAEDTSTMLMLQLLQTLNSLSLPVMLLLYYTLHCCLFFNNTNSVAVPFQTIYTAGGRLDSTLRLVTPPINLGYESTVTTAHITAAGTATKCFF